MLCDNRRTTVVALILGLPAVIAHVLYLIFPESFSYGLPIGAFVIFYFYLAVSMLRHVVRAEEVDGDIVAGAVCVYIMLGMVFAMLYAVLEQSTPGSFINLVPEASALTPIQSDVHFTTFLYFSFTTLTTLGYGDIQPATPEVQSLSSLEAITGVLYIGAFVARLITMYQPKVDQS